MTHRSKLKLVKCASSLVFVDAMMSFDDLIESKKFFNFSKAIKERDFKPEQAYKRQIEMNFFRLSNLPKNTMASTGEVLALIKHIDQRPAHLWEGLSQDNEKIKEHKDHLVMFLLKTVEQDKLFYAPGIRFDFSRPMLNLYGMTRHWKENDIFATVPIKYIYPPLF